MALRPQQRPCLRCWRLLRSHEPTGNSEGGHCNIAAVLPHSCRQLQPLLLPLFEAVVATQVLQSKGCQGLGGCPAATCCKVCCCLGVQQFSQHLPRRRQAPPPCGHLEKTVQDHCSRLGSSHATLCNASLSQCGPQGHRIDSDCRHRHRSCTSQLQLRLCWAEDIAQADSSRAQPSAHLCLHQAGWMPKSALLQPG